jgi:hypothetical protein
MMIMISRDISKRTQNSGHSTQDFGLGTLVFGLWATNGMHRVLFLNPKTQAPSPKSQVLCPSSRNLPALSS